MFLVPCCDVLYGFCIKAMFGSSLPLVVCGCLCPIRIVLCFCSVFLRLVYSMLPVSLDGSF
jgi:hypothetical protein